METPAQFWWLSRQRMITRPAVLRRMGFRWLLPLVQVPLYVVLIFLSYPEEVRKARIPASSQALSDTRQEPAEESIEFNPQYICRSAPLPLKLAETLNMPAALAAGMLSVTSLPDHVRGYYNNLHREFCVGLAVSPLVGFLWCFVGFWLDRQLGLIDRSPCRRSLVRRVLNWTLLAIGTTVFAAGIAVIAWRIIYFRWQNGLLGLGGMLLWPAFLAIVALLNIRRAGGERPTMPSGSS